MPPGPVSFGIRRPWPLALAIAGCACVWLSFADSPLSRFDRGWTDMLLRARLNRGLSPHPDPRIFLVGLELDDFQNLTTVADEYRRYGEIIDMNSDLGAAVTVFDLILAQGGPAEAAPVLAAARRSRGVVFAEADLGGKETMRSFPAVAANRPPAGLINIRPDSDGVVRGYEYARTVSGTCQPSLALAADLAVRGALGDLSCSPAGFVRWSELGPDQKTLIERSIPSSVATLNYRSRFVDKWDKGFRYASLHDLRRKYSDWKKRGGPVPADLPGPGSLVLVASVASGLGDSGPTPFGAYEPRVEVHATALSDLMQGEMLREASIPGQIGTIALLVAALAWGCAAANTSRRLLGLWLVLAAAPLVSGFFALTQGRMVFHCITPAALVTLCVLAEGGRRWGLTALEKVRMRATMAMYFSPRVLDEVLKNPGALEPREAELTVLLTDLRNFTTITERFGTPVVFDLMNRIFEIETRAVISLDGSMEHFLGDQFLGYWGAPQEQPDANDRAMKAGRLIIDGLNALGRTLPPEQARQFGFGLAIHRGKALVGNKGSSLRFDYGILGDIVNTAARAESLTKLYGVQWIITRAVLDPDAPPPHRFLDRVRVKGRAGSVELFEVRIDPDDNWRRVAERYGAAWLHYEAGRFPAALEEFEKLDDAPSRAMASRCRDLIAAPPAFWDGAYTLREK